MNRGTSEFVVTPPGRAPWLTLAAFGIGLPLVVISAALAERDGTGARAVLVTVALVGLLILGLGALIRRRSVRIEAGLLVVRAAVYTLRLAPAAIHLAQARVVDLDERRELRPRWKTNGYALPGFYAGHFRGAGLRERLFCLLTDRRRVLVLPLHDGRRLLLSLEHPQALLDALRAMPAH
jgi:hypothetical protein